MTFIRLFDWPIQSFQNNLSRKGSSTHVCVFLGEGAKFVLTLIFLGSVLNYLTKVDLDD